MPQQHLCLMPIICHDGHYIHDDGARHIEAAADAAYILSLLPAARHVARPLNFPFKAKMPAIYWVPLPRPPIFLSDTIYLYKFMISSWLSFSAS